MSCDHFLGQLWDDLVSAAAVLGPLKLVEPLLLVVPLLLEVDILWHSCVLPLHMWCNVCMARGGVLSQLAGRTVRGLLQQGLCAARDQLQRVLAGGATVLGFLEATTSGRASSLSGGTRIRACRVSAILLIVTVLGTAALAARPLDADSHTIRTSENQDALEKVASACGATGAAVKGLLFAPPPPSPTRAAAQPRTCTTRSTIHSPARAYNYLQPRLASQSWSCRTDTRCRCTALPPKTASSSPYSASRTAWQPSQTPPPQTPSDKPQTAALSAAPSRATARTPHTQPPTAVQPATPVVPLLCLAPLGVAARGPPLAMASASAARLCTCSTGCWTAPRATWSTGRARACT